MSDSAKIVGSILCPCCRTKILNSARFQWGAVPGTSYEIGEDIRWLRDSLGAIAPSFKLYSLQQGGWQWNCGDPQFKNVILFDEDVYTKNHILEYPKCYEVLAALVAIVENGKISAVTALLEQEVDQILGNKRDSAHIVVVRDDGAYWLREDWYDHAIEYVK